MRHTKYTKEILEPVVKASKNFTEVCRKFGVKHSGSSVTAMGNRIKKLGIDYSHFTGMGWRKGMKYVPKKDWTHYLVCRQDKCREKAERLRRCLIQSGREYKCVKCPNKGEWFGKKITLEVDHINEIFYDNRPENLQFMCPNCHAIKTYEDAHVAQLVEATG